MYLSKEEKERRIIDLYYNQGKNSHEIIRELKVSPNFLHAVRKKHEEERTAAAGITNISRNISQAISPSLTGIIINTFTLSSPFIIGGLLKIAYDIALYVNFRKIKPPEEEELKEEKDEE